MSPVFQDLPAAPGVYLHKGAGGEVLYVGKAKNLRARVRSYYSDDKLADVKTGSLMAEAVEVSVGVVTYGGATHCRAMQTNRWVLEAIPAPQRAVTVPSGWPRTPKT